MAIFKGDNGETIIELGHDDLMIGRAHLEGESHESELWFAPRKPDVLPESLIGKTTAEGGVEVRIVFASQKAVRLFLADVSALLEQFPNC